jgi:hypothetical protein
VAYVGSFGYHGLLSVDPNSVPSTICASAAGCTSGGIGTARGVAPQGTRYIPVTPTRPNRNLSGAFFWYTEGNASYNALQTDFFKRLSHGLQFRANYTWAKNLDMNSGLTGAQANNQAQMIMDRNDLRRDWGPSALNVKHQASISASYELPFGKGRMIGNGVSPVANHIIGGWQVNSIVSMLSGFPITPQTGSNRSSDGDTRNPDRPSLNPAFSAPVISGGQTQWFNPAAFAVPQAGTFGDLGRGVYTGPGLANVDLSLSKNFAITERVGLQFRAEAFNLLNHTNFGTPNAITFTASGTTFTPSPTAGLISTTVTSSRQMQFGLKLRF